MPLAEVPPLYAEGTDALLYEEKTLSTMCLFRHNATQKSASPVWRIYSKLAFTHAAPHVSLEAELLGLSYHTKLPALESSYIQSHFKIMCLLIITSHSHCGHNTYHYGKCSGNTHHRQCPESRTELGTLENRCQACERWADLARLTHEERSAWTREKDMAAQAERERRQSTLWQDSHPLGGRTWSTANSQPQKYSCVNGNSHHLEQFPM